MRVIEKTSERIGNYGKINWLAQWSNIYRENIFSSFLLYKKRDVKRQCEMAIYYPLPHIRYPQIKSSVPSR